jgi:hypothetical protein
MIPYCSLPTGKLASDPPALSTLLLLLLAAAVAVVTAAAAGWRWALQDVYCPTAGANCQHLAMLWVAPGELHRLIRQLQETK